MPHETDHSDDTHQPDNDTRDDSSPRTYPSDTATTNSQLSHNKSSSNSGQSLPHEDSSLSLSNSFIDVERERDRPPTSQPRKASSTKKRRGSVLSQGSNNLRDTFFGAKKPDPLATSAQEEFDLTVIDERGGMSETIAQILAPDLRFHHWSRAGYSVTAFGCISFIVTYSLALGVDHVGAYYPDPGFIFGSLLTLLTGAVVFVTYVGVQNFQAHPNPLIYYKCVIDILLALRFIFDPLLHTMGVYRARRDGYDNDHTCSMLSGVTQFLLFASEGWYFMLIFDLYRSLRNPFTSVKGERFKYKIAVYTTGGFLGLLVAYIPGAHGFADGNFCWTDRGAEDADERSFFDLNLANWLFFYSWIMLFYIAGISVLLFGVKRLRSGLRDTLDARKDMLRNGAISITSFTFYWTIVFIWYAVSFDSRAKYGGEQRDKPSDAIFRTYSYLVGGRGIVDYFVWFMVNRPANIRDGWLRFSSESVDRKFSAQLNPALQRELIYFTVEGMNKAVRHAEDTLVASRNQSPPHETEDRRIDINGLDTETMLHKRGSKREQFLRSVSGLVGLKWRKVSSTGQGIAEKSALANEIRFTTYKPKLFAELRSAHGIQAEAFEKSFQSSTKPKISEGASGAFLFYSGDKKFLVKSLDENECRFLNEIAEEYVDYLIRSPWSYITKFYGCFKITFADKEFYFAVMENLFGADVPGMQVHHRYDIKGSWVNRSYKRPRRGAMVKCRHCSMKFKYGGRKMKLRCPHVVGVHEPNVVLKDNDLHTRMRLGDKAGKELFDSLREDSLFLCQLGIMDYSLLLGVMDIEFDVDDPTSNRGKDFSAQEAEEKDPELRETLENRDIRASTEARLSYGNSYSTLQQVSGETEEAKEESNPLAMSRHPSPMDTSDRSASSLVKSKRVFGPALYYVGIIDILQTWSWQKRCERFYKVHVERQDPDGVSAIDPISYQRRFEAKLRDVIALPKRHAKSKPKLKFTGSSSRRSRESNETSRTSASREGNQFPSDSEGLSSSESLPLENDMDLIERSTRNPEPILMQFSQKLLRASHSAPSDFM